MSRCEQKYIRGLNEGDEDAFRSIFNLFNARLCYFAGQLLAGEELPEDIVQDAFMKLWERRGNFTRIEAVKTFLYVTVKNRCLNISKHRVVKNRYLHSRNDFIEERTAVNNIIEAEVLHHMYNAIRELPSACRQVMRLSFDDGLNNKEIARQLDISVNTVKTQKLRGLRFLREAIKVTSSLLIFIIR